MRNFVSYMYVISCVCENKLYIEVCESLSDAFDISSVFMLQGYNPSISKIENPKEWIC